MLTRRQTQDSTFEFEKRRNRPVKYDRNLVRKTIAAMERVEEIKQRRAEDHYRLRCVADCCACCQRSLCSPLAAFCAVVVLFIVIDNHSLFVSVYFCDMFEM
jgi:hypothetical protein